MAKQKDVVDRKEQIIEAAADLFMNHSAPSIKLTDVAKRAKVPAPLIHYYFTEIDDLHYEVVLKVLAELTEVNLKDLAKYQDDPLRMMKEYLKALFPWIKKNTNRVNVWLYFYYMSTRSKKFEDLNSEIRKTARDRIALMIYRGLEKKVFIIPANRTVEELAYFIQTLMTGYIVVYCTEAKLKPMEAIVSELEAIVFNLLGVKEVP